MKRLLGIVASHRKLGNGEIVAKAVAENLGGQWDLALIRLVQLKIQACKGCYACLNPATDCRIEDDVAWILERMAEADAILFTAPDYCLAPVGMVKMLADRSLQAQKFFEQFSQKKVVAALTLGKEDYRGYADTALASEVRVLGFDVARLERFYGTHPGETALADDFPGKIQALAAALSGREHAATDEPGRCPRCFSDLFRLRPEGWECAVCKALAVQENGKLRFVFFHPIFTLEGWKEHMEWLLMKKGEYRYMKEKLQTVRDHYREGRWLTPGQPWEG